MDGAVQRRKEVSEYIKAEKAAREKAYREGKNVELPGKPNKSIKQRYAEQDNGGKFIVPLAPFGMPEYDGGERWDLKAPYAEKGYVDEKADWSYGIKKLFGGGKKKD